MFSVVDVRRGWQQRAHMPAAPRSAAIGCPTVAFKMADGLCTEGTVGNIIEKTLVKDYTNIVKCLDTDQVNDLACDNVKSFYIRSDSDKIYTDMCGKGSDDGFMNVPCTEREEDCMKKRCTDRYDSSESSDR